MAIDVALGDMKKMEFLLEIFEIKNKNHNKTKYTGDIIIILCVDVVTILIILIR